MTEERSVRWKTIIPNILEDQKSIYWDVPRSPGKGEHWIPTTIFLAGIGTLIPTDQYKTPYFRRTSTFRGFNNGFSSTNTSLMIAAVPAAVREHVRKLSLTPESAVARRARNKIEALFSELRNQIRLRKVRLRGLRNAKEQFILAATAQNLKRLMKFLDQPEGPTPVTA